MKRLIEKEILSWYNETDRPPLILRGPRQIGKTTTVKIVAKENNIDLFEINLEREGYHSLTKEKIDIYELLAEIESKFKRKPTKESMLFFDEIQESPALIESLRYFYEDNIGPAIIAAGSLLELVIKKEEISFPVGRVRFLYMVPMTFCEFLLAIKEEQFAQSILENNVREFMHNDLVKLLKKYFYIGGMPKAILTFIETQSLSKVRGVHLDIVETYAADFPKYAKRIDYKRIEKIFKQAAYQVGKKVKYQNFDSESGSREVKNAIELLIDAMVVVPAIHSECSGLPLDATLTPSIYKLYFLDIGLMNAIQKLDYHFIDEHLDAILVNKGVIAEQFIAQHLQQFYNNRQPPELRYWVRDKGTSKAEVDFVIQKDSKIIPIEVKAEKGGKLKSLFIFALEKNWKEVILFNNNFIKKYKTSHKSNHLINDAPATEITITNLPLYMIESILPNIVILGYAGLNFLYITANVFAQ